MTIILTFIVNAGLNFILGLLVAKFLGPEEFGRYAIAAAVAAVLNSMLLEWLRQSATRFYSERTRTDAPAVRATLDVTVASISLSLAALLAVAIAAGADLRLPAALVAATAGMGVASGLFDYHAALARARFQERTYAVLVIVKNVAAFVLMVGGAFVYESAAIVLAGFCVSVAAALVVARRALRDPGLTWRLADRRLALTYARYGLPLVAAVTIYQLAPFANRAALAAFYGYAEAGKFSLAADLGIRIFAVAGSALDILLFQIAVRTDEMHGRAEAERQLRRNATIVLAILAPAAAGYWLALPAFEALLVPVAFRGAFAMYTTILIPGLFAFGIIQFALNPAFQIAKRTAPVIAASLVALLVNGGLMIVLPRYWGASGFAMAQTGGMLAALAVAFVLASRVTRLAPTWRDAAVILAATLTMMVALFPLRERAPLDLMLPTIMVLGALIYAGSIAAFDVAGLRSAFMRRLQARRSQRAA